MLMPEGKAVVMPGAPFDYVTMKTPPVTAFRSACNISVISCRSSLNIRDNILPSISLRRTRSEHRAKLKSGKVRYAGYRSLSIKYGRRYFTVMWSKNVSYAAFREFFISQTVWHYEATQSEVVSRSFKRETHFIRSVSASPRAQYRNSMDKLPTRYNFHSAKRNKRYTRYVIYKQKNIL